MKMRRRRKLLDIFKQFFSNSSVTCSFESFSVKQSAHYHLNFRIFTTTSTSMCLSNNPYIYTSPFNFYHVVN